MIFAKLIIMRVVIVDVLGHVVNIVVCAVLVMPTKKFRTQKLKKTRIMMMVFMFTTMLRYVFC